ncbi:MAG: AAA family ATPase [Hymenobacteraceae bacterium]|nr:AAA family ATPase [Hymenobacteraceae bacterium]
MRITRDHILAALAEIDRERPPLPRSLGYDVVYRGRLYPPVQVMRIAHRLATGVDEWPIPGGAQTNKILEAAGFTVVSKKQLALLKNQPLDSLEIPPPRDASDELPALPVAMVPAEKRAFLPAESAGFSVAAEPADELSTLTTPDDLTADLFLSPARFLELLGVLRTRKTLVLQGPPGTGKSLLARRLAAALTDVGRTETLQLHAASTYDDLLIGYRPGPGGGFGLREGTLLRLAQRAHADRRHAFVLVLEELTRAPPAAVLGEALTLLPAEARSAAYALRLPAAAPDAPAFWLPPNLCVIATLNPADRTLAPLDYALRRRFAFADVNPETGERFRKWLIARGVPPDFTERLAGALAAVNEAIATDPTLGAGLRLGHSYFTTPPPTEHAAWLARIVEFDLGPLLDELFADEPATAQRHRRRLLAVAST